MVAPKDDEGVFSEAVIIKGFEHAPDLGIDERDTGIVGPQSFEAGEFRRDCSLGRDYCGRKRRLECRPDHRREHRGDAFFPGDKDRSISSARRKGCGDEKIPRR